MIREKLKNAWTWIKSHIWIIVAGVFAAVISVLTGKTVLDNGKSINGIRDNTKRAGDVNKRAKDEVAGSREQARIIRDKVRDARDEIKQCGAISDGLAENNRRAGQILEKIRKEQQVEDL